MTHILIVVAMACGGRYCDTHWPVMSFQEFNSLKACATARAKATEVVTSHLRVQMMCVPKG